MTEGQNYVICMFQIWQRFTGSDLDTYILKPGNSAIHDGIYNKVE